MFVMQIYCHDKCKETLDQLYQLSFPQLVNLHNFLNLQTAFHTIQQNSQVLEAEKARARQQ